MKKQFLGILPLLVICFTIIYGLNFAVAISDVTFFEDFTEENLSQEWNFVHVAAGGDISSNEGVLNIRASPLFQDSPNSAMVMRHWLSQNDNFLNISVRLKINSFDRFAIQVDHKKTLSYSDLSPMFGLVFRAAGTPTSDYILAVGKQNGEWKGGLGVEGSLVSNLKVNEWYQSEIFIQESPYTVVFTLMDDQRNVLIQETIDANSLTNYNFEEIGSVGFNAWTSLKDGPYGNTDIDWLEVTTESNPSYTATPTPNPSPTEPEKNPTFISIATSSPYSDLGSAIIVNGILFDSNGITLKDEIVVLSYTFIGSNSWLPISSSSTNNVGEYSVQWINTASGTFTIKAQWAGNATHNGVSNITSLSILPIEDKTTFLVESNSTISALEFNSTTSELNFVASGQSGTGGYTKVAIAKSLISNSENIKVYLDGNHVEHSLSSNSDFWILNFGYSHSSHHVSIRIQSSLTTNLLGMDYWYLIFAIAIVTIVVIICLLIWQLKTRKKKWAHSKKKLLEIVKTQGHIGLNETSKQIGLKITQIKKLLSEVGFENAEAQGFFIKQGTEFISKIAMADKIHEMGKFSFIDFASKFGISEDNSKKILSDLLTENMIKGAFSSDGRGFVTEYNLMNEIAKD